MAPHGTFFDRASVNVSQVHYDDEASRRLSSATALSAIVHPASPRVPSVHTHISLTKMRGGRAYWRMMADLNPSVPVEDDRLALEAAIEAVVGSHLDAGRTAGDRYFYIPALERHRGVYHFYLEGFDSGDLDADRGFAERFGHAVIDAYAKIFTTALERSCSASDHDAQRRYHTLYLFQVLTLDRGTTSGLLVHDQNDVGILGSLPSVVDAQLLRSWADAAPSPQGELVVALADVLGNEAQARVDDARKLKLAATVRAHYAAHPQALALQASGTVVPPTVANHGRTDD